MYILKGVYSIPNANQYNTLSDLETAKQLAIVHPYNVYWDDLAMRDAYMALYGPEALERLRTENLAVVHYQKERAVPEAVFVPADTLPAGPEYWFPSERKVASLNLSELYDFLKNFFKSLGF